ncbi:MAG: septum formation protein Maf [Nanoarchaeota archaeon]|nr:septum formation protein Maf [Nanoarchaeota archaeon]MBU1270277.1 septum formation protein Maf [Nanoarchaeota archaeon]MBU1604192.1 septum formation protein Maf [Nanoarchaeota archaeon]MBU2443147.1 septum formation protein Maf [Nanoarchaeota archaeon]
MRQIILASTSPRRKNLLKQLIGDNFKIVSSSYEEDNNLDLDPKNLVLHHSLQKGRSVAEKLKTGVVISADTLIVLDNKIIGKPHTKENSISTLKNISGKNILVVTGIIVIDVDKKKELQDYEFTTVKITKLSEKEINDYVNSGEPLDKAGAFGIQEKGAFMVEKIDGDYFNVAGLPLFKLTKLLEKIGVSIFGYK